MPDTFPEGMRLRFELQACPVVRKGSAGTIETRHGPRSWKAGEEIDPFLLEAWATNRADAPQAPKPDRETVYRNWLVRQLGLRGGARLEEGTFAMERFAIARMTRRAHGSGAGRRTTRFQAPDATFTGRLTVTDSDAFRALLRSGLGRQKSFGYGMLKVRRA
jgi:CRISPR system Cascade subunit CasE